MNNPKVLVSVVTYDGHKYCYKEFFDRVKSLTYPNYSVFVVDNSKSKEYSEFLKKEYPTFEIARSRNLGKKMGIRAGCRSEKKVLERFFNEPYKTQFEYWLHLESDLIVPADIIQKLMVYEKDVVSASYYIDWYGTNNPLNCVPIPVVFKNEFDIRKNEFEGQFWHLSMYKPEEVKSGNGLKQVWGIGAGCFLATRKAARKIRHFDGMVSLSIDYWFCLNWDSSDWGEVIPRFVDTDLVIPHVKKDLILGGEDGKNISGAE
jgi:GT2 family glycosyltransferase